MDITEFYQKKSSEDQNVRDTKRLKSHFGKMLNEKRIIMSEYEFCMDYIDNGHLLKNSKMFDIIAKKIDMIPELDLIIQSHNSKNLVAKMKEEREKVIYFIDERLAAIDMLLDTIYDNERMLFGMYGYAGTGKTTLIMEIVQFLILHNLVKSVVFTAPTHKALNVMKTNFNKLMPNLLDKMKVFNQNVFDNNLLELRTRGLKIEFVTIHKLLGYSMDFTNNGERIFTKKTIPKRKTCKSTDSDSDMTRNDIIIIDECSMISIQMIIEMFSEIRRQWQKSKDCNKIPKIIFTGDPAQLPPVNEKTSSIFIKSKGELPFTEYLKAITVNQNSFATYDTLKSDYEKLVNDIINMRTITLKQIFRNTKSNVLDLCLNVRQWVVNDIKHPTLGKYVGNGVVMYKYDGKEKTNSEWFKKCVDMFRTGDMSNIILTWTNNCSDVYNNTIRKILLNKDTIDVFEIGDILILNDFYCFDDSKNKKETTNEEDTRFYTSEQLKILDLCVVDKKVVALQDCVPQSVRNLKDSPEIIKKYKMAVSKINSMTKRVYSSWKMKVLRLSDNICKNISNKEHTVYVIHESSVKQLSDDSEVVVKMIRILLKSYQMSHSGQLATIERFIMKPLWKYWNDNFVAQFANVIFGYSVTTHKAQGSTFNNVFVDADDILQNTNENEAKRCIYTSHTRCSNEIHILA